MNIIPEIIVNVKQNVGGAWITHTLEEHLNETASIEKNLAMDLGVVTRLNLPISGMILASIGPSTCCTRSTVWMRRRD